METNSQNKHKEEGLNTGGSASEGGEAGLLYRTLFEQSPDGIVVIDTGGTVVQFNEAAHTQMGYTREEFEGIHLSRLTLSGSREEIQAKAREIIKAGKAEFRIKRKTKQGDIKDIHIITQTINLSGKVFFHSIWRDITGQKKAEEALSESEDKYRALVESTDDSIYLVNRDFKYLFMNKRHTARLGIQGNEYVGRTYGDFHTPEETEAFIKDAVKVFETGESAQHEYRSVRDGGYFVQTLSAVKDKAGKTVAVTIVSKDITERKKMEEELRLLSLTDELTGLYNRRGFRLLTEQYLRLCKRRKQGAYMLYADVDGLKRINDVFGHQAGDSALIDTAEILKTTCRISDIIARTGGDEFVVIPLGISVDDVKKIISRLEKNIAIHNSDKRRGYALSISFGISYYDPESGTTLDELAEQAEKMMYEQKNSKRKAG
ncbi:MAG: PAS domain S-box protein [Nitrospiraceae bacterium]|nr:PAS domain S-box protein [Nitrospiraceae bacterium]